MRIRASLVLLALAGACKRELISIPSGPQELVIHGVLNPADTMQLVLIERTITGAVATPLVYPFTIDEPIYSDWGVAESAATTQIIAPDGTVIPGTELPECYQVPDRLCRGNGGGVYKFFLRGSNLVPGGKYVFRAVTAKGEVITAETIVPETPQNTATANVTFNRSTDTLNLSWQASPRAPAYLVRVENMFGAWTSFTDSTRVALTGGLRNPDQARLPHVFLPGFQQNLSVTAVDANLYDYYRTTNNSFVGYGAVSRVHGAFGVFGAAVTVQRRTVSVTANQVQPIEGNWVGTGYFAKDLSLFIESAATRANEADAISGSYTTVPGNTFTMPLTGTFRNGEVRIVFHRNQVVADTAESFVGNLRGDTITGKYRLGAIGVFVRR